MPIHNSKSASPSTALPPPIATPASTVDGSDTSDVVLLAGGRPDKQAHDNEQERLKREIDALQLKLNTVRDKISLSTKFGTDNERKNALKAELDNIRNTQSSNKLNRDKLFEQRKSLQDNLHKKIKDLQAAKAKVPYKTVADIDARIKDLERQVESGNMKLADEKRALQEISTVKRSRRTVEGFQAEDDAIAAHRQQIEELNTQLDDPEAKAISERFSAIKAELDEIKKHQDEVYAGRNKLFEERDAVNGEMKTLLSVKRQKYAAFREANDKYWAKANEDRAKRAEKLKAQRLAEEQEKKLEIAQRIRDEASMPAFQAQIEDCQTLIDFFSGKTTGNVTYKSTGPLMAKNELVGVPKLETRKVEDVPQGAVVRKKKGEDEENYFVGGKGKKGKKGAVSKASSETESTTPSSDKLQIAFPTLSALLSLSIPTPANQADVSRVIEDLSTKKAWFEANQARVTSENIAKAEAEIARLTGSNKDVKASTETPASDITPPNGGGEVPAEPAPTPQVGGVVSVPVDSSPVEEQLETVQENEVAA